MNRNGKNARAVRYRTELLASFDTLASHLSTTFTALSTAFARSAVFARDCGGGSGSGGEKRDNVASGMSRGKDETVMRRERRAVRAYLAILIGPSVGSARSKVVFAVDGLEVRVWGERDDVVENDEGEEGDGLDSEGETEESEVDEEEGEGDEEGSDNEDEEDEDEEDEKIGRAHV